jgi:hypothetical protein
MIYYTSVIQKLRKELGLPPANCSHNKGKVQQEKEFGT